MAFLPNLEPKCKEKENAHERQKSAVCLSSGLACASLSSVSVALAQGIDGTRRGEVKDNSGAVVPNASVTITRDGTGETRKVLTSTVGVFHIPSLLPGTYTVTVELQGFQKHVRRGVELRANQIAEVGVVLELGTPETVVEVQGGAELIQTTTAQLGGVISVPPCAGPS